MYSYTMIHSLSNKELKEELKQYTIFIYKNSEWTYNPNSYHNRDYLSKLATEDYIRQLNRR